jgi:signal transduction histidine kinase
VFDDFYRGDHDVSQTTRGTGIWLALVIFSLEALYHQRRLSRQLYGGGTP